MGDAMTSWSGGENWNDPELVSKIRQWVYEGGGFIGIGEPTAYNKDGRLFALSDVLGVQKEIGLTASHNKPALTPNKERNTPRGRNKHKRQKAHNFPWCNGL